MIKAQAVADLSFQLTGITTAERAQELIRRALRTTGLTRATRIDETDMQDLLQVLAAEGGMIEELAQQLAQGSLARPSSMQASSSAAQASTTRSRGASSGEVPQSAA